METQGALRRGDSGAVWGAGEVVGHARGESYCSRENAALEWRAAVESVRVRQTTSWRSVCDPQVCVSVAFQVVSVVEDCC